MENPIKMDDLGVPLFLETAICCGSFSARHDGRGQFLISTSSPKPLLGFRVQSGDLGSIPIRRIPDSSEFEVSSLLWRVEMP